MSDEKRPTQSPLAPVYVENGGDGNAPQPPEPPTGQPDPRFPQPPNRRPVLNGPDAKEIKSAQTLVVVGSIAGPVSVFVGGVLLSAVGLVCAFLGYRKLKHVGEKQGDAAVIASRLKRSAIIALVICGVALVLNAVAFFIMYPILLEAVQSGDYSSLMPGSGSGSTAAPSSTWG